MLASPEVTYCCAQEKSRKGSTQKVVAMTLMCAQMRAPRGRCSRRTATKTPSVSAPRTSRDHTTCPGETPARATFMKRKLEPQTMPPSTNCAVIDDVREEGPRAGEGGADAVDTA